KIARDQVRQDRLMLNNFRRGVRSMGMLSNSSIVGVPRIIDVSELPPYIVMEFVNGKTLDRAVFENLLSSLADRIKAVRLAAEILLQCHRHENTILHRDLRPSNIMIDGDLWGSGALESVVVLDFDLSWHVGANDDEYIMTNANALGYL